MTNHPKKTSVLYGSVCSGIEAASVAWHQIGWRPAWFSEIEKFPSAVLAHHYPDVPNLGDMTTIAGRITTGEVLAPDILVGGTPCQAFSIAGLRHSLNDDRGQLTLEYVRLANEIDAARTQQGKDPAIIVWENVPGVLSTKDNAFGCFIGALSGSGCELQPAGKKWTNSGCVHGPQRTVAWRIMDAQHFGVAQRRRRLFVVASTGKGFNPAQILFEWEGLRRDIAPDRTPRQEITGIDGTGFKAPIFQNMNEPVQTLCASDSHGVGNQSFFEGKVLAQFFDPICMASGQGGAEVAQNRTPTLTCNHETPITTVYGIPANWIGRLPENGGHATKPTINISPCLTTMGRHGVAYNIADYLAVRRLTPQEYERLQGFPDFYTQIPYRNKPSHACPDSPRYKALGNSMAVPVMHWLGNRINLDMHGKLDFFERPERPTRLPRATSGVS